MTLEIEIAVVWLTALSLFGVNIWVGIIGIMIALFVTQLALSKDYAQDIREHPREKILDDLRDRLKNPKGAAFYQDALKDMLDWADGFFGGPGPWSARAYDRMLLLAVAYPVLSALIGWAAFGDAGNLGAALGLAKSGDGLFRLAVMIWLAGSVLLFSLSFRLDGWKFWAMVILPPLVYKYGLSALQGLFPDEKAFAVAFPFAVAFAVAFAGAVAVSGAVAVAGAVAVSGAFTGVVAGAFAVSGAFSVAGAFGKYPRLVLTAVSIAPIAAVYILLINSPAVTTRPHAAGLMLGLVILPLVNAPFDFASTGLTRFLLRRNLDAKGVRRRITLSLADAAAALVLLIALAVAMIWAIEGFNAAAGHDVANIAGLIGDMRRHPFAGRHFWVYFALFSTLVPTMLHAVLAVWSFIGMPLPGRVRSFMLEQIGKAGRAEDETNALRLVRIALAARWWLAAVLTMTGAFVIGFIILGLMGAGGYFADFLLWMDALARAAFRLAS